MEAGGCAGSGLSGAGVEQRPLETGLRKGQACGQPPRRSASSFQGVVRTRLARAASPVTSGAATRAASLWCCRTAGLQGP